MVGAQHGVDTTQPAGAVPVIGTSPTAAAPAKGGDNAAVMGLLQKYACVACHGVANKIVGPAYRDVAKKYAGRADAAGYLAGKIKSGGSGVWGQIPMPPQTLTDAEAQTIAKWLADGAK